MYSIFDELMKSRGITMYRVAKETGISQATLIDWKNGKYTPKIDKMQKIADFFEVTLDYLLGNVEDPNGIKLSLSPANGVSGTQKEKPATPEDDELNEYLDFLKNREEGRMLFSLAKNATKEDVMRAVAVIDALRREDERQK